MIVACELESTFEEFGNTKFDTSFRKVAVPRNASVKSRAIVYVSQWRATCDGRTSTNEKDSGQLSHFHLNRSLHEHSIAFLRTLFSGGIQQLLWEQNPNKNVVH
ncbi:hypothetical protein NPIL_696931 [Nephila pilipes]|uniref:Uncharacterized protein n=1 Tax=Nephila pilipes TaxID=299642 RepID=A0A8X6ULH3_NEPPI|nr:hypothetical protein NPIL_696931 [Nephila pilipes]